MRPALFSALLLLTACPASEDAPAEPGGVSAGAGTTPAPARPLPPEARPSAGPPADPSPPAPPEPEPEPAAPSAPTEASNPAAEPATEEEEAPSAPEATGPDPVEAARIGQPYALPKGGGVADAAQRVETVRQLVDGLGQRALTHAARMRGDQPDVTGSTEVDVEAEKARYLTELRATHRSMRELMHAVARCPDADPKRPVSDRSAPINRLAEEIDRYAGRRPTAREADDHIEKLRPLVVDWKSVEIDPAAAQAASAPDWQPPRALTRSWCP